MKSYDLGHATVDNFERDGQECGMSLEEFIKYWWNETGYEGRPFTWETLGSGYGYEGDEVCRVGNVVFKEIYGQLMADEYAPGEYDYHKDFQSRLQKGDYWTK